MSVVKKLVCYIYHSARSKIDAKIRVWNIISCRLIMAFQRSLLPSSSEWSERSLGPALKKESAGSSEASVSTNRHGVISEKILS